MPTNLPISGLITYSTLHTNDLLVVVDTHDTTYAPTGTDKQATISQMLQAAVGTVTNYASATLGIGNAVVAQGSTTYGTDQAANLQALLTASVGGTLVIDGQYSITTSLSIPSNITIVFPKGCGLIRQANQLGPMMYNSGMISGGVISSTARGVGGSDGTANGNATPATLSAIGSFPNANIHIVGGILNCNGQNQSTTYNSTYGFFVGLQFWGVDGLRIEDMHVYDSVFYAIHLANVRDVSLLNYKVDQTNRLASGGTDGVHVNGPAQYLNFVNCDSLCSDDNLALNADDGGFNHQDGPFPFPGPITDVNVNGWYINHRSGGANTRFLSLISASQLIDRVTVQGVRGNTGNYIADMYSYLYGLAPPIGESGTFGVSNFGTITCRDWHINLLAPATTAPTTLNAVGSINMQVGSGNFTFDNIHVYSPTVAQSLFWIDARYGNYTAQSVVINNCSYDEAVTTANNAPLIELNGRCKNLQISNCRVTRAAGLAAADSPILKVMASGNSPIMSEYIKLDGCHTDNVNSMVEVAGGRIGLLQVSGYHHNSNGNTAVTIASGATVDNLDTVKLYSDVSPNYTNAGTVTTNITTGGTFAIRAGIPNLWDGLLAYYRFNETTGTTVTDQLGSYNLTAHATITDTTGKISGDNAAVFGGAQYYLSSDTAANAQRLEQCALQAQPYSFGGWVNFSSVSTTQVLAGRGGASPATFWGIIYLASSKFSYNASATPINDSTTRSTSTWYHVMGVCDPYGQIGAALTTYFYINGSLSGTGGFTAPSTPVAADPFCFGSSYTAGTATDYLTAALNGWGIWALPLTAAQVSLAYNGGTGINVI
jgi:Concanavalin A-like lectin/glucanases superfamily